MSRVTFLKILLILVAGASAVIPLRRLMERKGRAAGADVIPQSQPATVADPVERKPAGPASEPAPESAPVPAFSAMDPSAEKPVELAPEAKPPAPLRPSVPPPPAATFGQKTYVVKEGDSFWSIAEKELGSGKHAKKIIDANRDRIDPDNLKVGQVLVLPDLDAEIRRFR